jgi:hypothetical protein
MTMISFWPSWITWLPEEQREEELFRLIRSGEKTKTTRKKPKTGKYYQLYYGKRGSKKKLIAEVVPDCDMSVFIDKEKQEILIDGSKLTEYSLNKYLEMDGFRNHSKEFWEFFETGEYYSIDWFKPVEREISGWRLP